MYNNNMNNTPHNNTVDTADAPRLANQTNLNQIKPVMHSKNCHCTHYFPPKKPVSAPLTTASASAGLTILNGSSGVNPVSITQDVAITLPPMRTKVTGVGDTEDTPIPDPPPR